MIESGHNARSTTPAPPLAEAVTGVDGRAPVAVPVLEDLAVLVDHPGFAPALLRPGTASRVEEIRLDAGRSWSSAIAAVDSEELPSGGTVCVNGRFGVRIPHRQPTWRRCADVMPGGEFELGGLPDGALAVDVQIPGFLRLTRMIEPRKGLRLEVERGVLVEGRVTDLDGHGVAGARINSEGAATVQADASGRFTLSVPRLPAQIHVTALGYRQRTVGMTEPGQRKIRLEPTEQVYGTLLTEPGQEPSSVRVQVQRVVEGGTRGKQRTVDTPEGQFLLDLPEPGSYALIIMAPGYRDVRYPDIDIGPGQAYPLGVIPLDRGAGVQGAVSAAVDGAPLEGVLVEAFPVGAGLMQALMGRGGVSAVTAKDGTFTLAGLDVGRYELRWRRAGYATVHRILDLERDGLIHIGVLYLDRGVMVHGRVTDRTGAPRAGLGIQFFDPAAEVLRPWAQTVTDTEGRYQLAAVSGGRYRVQILDEGAPASAPRLLFAQEVEITPGEPRQRLDLQVGGVEVRGRLWYDGLPVTGGMVAVTPALEPAARRGKISVSWAGQQLSYGAPQSALVAEVAKDGSFTIADVPPGVVWLGYHGVDGREVSRRVVVPDRAEAALDVELRGRSLEGRIVDAATDAGLASRIEVFDLTGRLAAAGASDSEGWFRLEDLAAGRYDLEVTAQGYVTARLLAVEVSEQSLAQQIELQRGEPGGVEVTLLRPDGDGVPAAPVTIYDLQGTLVRSRPTPGSGRLTFEELAAGEYFVAWSEPLAGAGATPPVEVIPDRPQVIETTLSTGASVVLSCPVHRCAGAPVELLTVHSRDGLELSPLLSGVSPALHFSSEGDVSLGRLAPGHYAFRLWADGERWEREVAISAGEARVSFF